MYILKHDDNFRYPPNATVFIIQPESIARNVLHYSINMRIVPELPSVKTCVRNVSVMVMLLNADTVRISKNED